MAIANELQLKVSRDDRGLLTIFPQFKISIYAFRLYHRKITMSLVFKVKFRKLVFKVSYRMSALQTKFVQYSAIS